MIIFCRDTAVERILVTLREAFRDPVKYIPAPLPLLTEHDDHDETVSRVDTESADLLLRKVYI